MSVIGFDIGNQSCVIAAAKRGGIDVLLNDESKRETQSVVSFGENQRFIGAASATANPRSTISQVKRLVGRLYNDPSVQEDLKLLPFLTTEGPRGGIWIEIDYLKEKWMFTPVEIIGMLFSHLKQITEKNLESPVVDCVIGIPSYFTDLQRREYLDAAHIAGLRPLRLMHDGTATALGYGMYKTDFSDSGPTNAVFVDIGHCDTQVTVAAFELGQMKILSHSFDENLGGRDFDEVLFKHFAAQFKEKHKIDVYFNARACIRLRAACEKVKKVLSANAEAPISIDCLIDDTDVRGIITREEFENLSSKLLERITVPCIKALKNSGLCVDEISTIELVGSGSRIPIIMKILTSFFRKEPTRTLNASECVARGCALFCAILSPTLQVREYKIQEYFPYSIAIPVHEGKNKPRRELILFRKGSRFPKLNKVDFYEETPIHFQVFYTNKTDFPAGVSPKVGEFMIGPPQPSGEEVQGDLKVQLNRHGIFEIKSASFLEDKRTTLSSYIFPEKMVTSSHMSNLAFSENLDASTSKDELDEAQARERMLAEQDIKVETIKDQRNTLESFVYDSRSKLSGAYRGFATDSEKEVILNSLQDTEDWLYEDIDDESEQDYTRKLDDLKKLLYPVEKKYKDYKEEKATEQAIKALQTCIEEHRSKAESMPTQFRMEVKKEINTVENWLSDISKYHSSPKKEDSVIWSSAIKNNMETFQRRCKKIIESLPSFSKHDKPMNLNRRQQPVKSADSDLSDELVDSAPTDKSADSDQGDKAVDSEQRDKTVDSGDQTVESDQRDQIVDSDQRDQIVDSDQKGQFVDADQKDQRDYMQVD